MQRRLGLPRVASLVHSFYRNACPQRALCAAYLEDAGKFGLSFLNQQPLELTCPHCVQQALGLTHWQQGELVRAYALARIEREQLMRERQRIRAQLAVRPPLLFYVFAPPVPQLSLSLSLSLSPSLSLPLQAIEALHTPK